MRELGYRRSTLVVINQTHTIAYQLVIFAVGYKLKTFPATNILLADLWNANIASSKEVAVEVVGTVAVFVRASNGYSAGNQTITA